MCQLRTNFLCIVHRHPRCLQHIAKRVSDMYPNKAMFLGYGPEKTVSDMCPRSVREVSVSDTEMSPSIRAS